MENIFTLSSSSCRDIIFYSNIYCLQKFRINFFITKIVKEQWFKFGHFSKFTFQTKMFLPCNWDIIIIIMLCRKHGYPWPSLATSPYHSSPLAGRQGYISYPHIAAVCMFELVILHLLGHMWGSIGVHHLWAHPFFSSSVLYVRFI